MSTLNKMFPTATGLDEMDINLLLTKMQITTTTTTTTTLAPAVEGETTVATTVATPARRKRSAEIDGEEVKLEGVNKFIPRSLIAGVQRSFPP